jgi:hypothetical protein
MEVFYDLLESFFEAFAERWPQIKQKHLEGDWAGDVESNSDEPLVPEL